MTSSISRSELTANRDRDQIRAPQHSIRLSIYAPQSRQSVPGLSSKGAPVNQNKYGADTAQQEFGYNFASECLFSWFTMLYNLYLVLRQGDRVYGNL